MHSLLIFFASLLFFVIVDAFWIGYFARDLYVGSLKHFLRYADGQYNVIWWAALVVWICITLGAFLFVLPQVRDQSYAFAALYGALYGLVLYGVYDFTNYSLFVEWPLQIALIDVVWGACINALLVVFMKWLAQ